VGTGDVLENLTGVNHTGYGVSCTSLAPAINPSRTFVYDSLSRLKTATNAESSGNTTYTYYDTWNLYTRTDGQGRTATLTYDPLNRLTDKTYSDSTPPAHYAYFGTQDFVSSVTSSASSYNYSNYDAFGRPGAGTQQTSGQPNPFTFPSITWTPQGQVSSIKYPSGRVVTTSFDGAGRPSGVQGSLNNGTPTNYITMPTDVTQAYAAHGEIQQVTTGDQLLRNIGYNAWLQTTSVNAGSLLTLGFTYSASQNNGNLLSQTITRPGYSSTQTYAYDGANRLQAAAEGSGSVTFPNCMSPAGTTWSQTYVYDNVGNRAVLSSGNIPVSDNTPQTGSCTFVPFDATNHWNTTSVNFADYDGAGNVLKFNKQSATVQSLTYDAEERMTSWSATASNTTTTVTFTYDGDGRRVTKTTAAGTTVYVYDPAGNLAAEYGGAGPTVAGPVYLTQDHLGSTRLVSNSANGQPQAIGCHDYLPFGEEIPTGWGRSTVPCYAQTGDTPIKFTGKERDAETGLDFFEARYYSPAQGRFLSMDPGNAGANPTDPQTWNGFGYVGNNPLVNTDPDGMGEYPDYCDIYSDDPHCSAFYNPCDYFGCLTQGVQQVMQQTWNYVKNINWQYPSCVAGRMGQWGAAGTAGGAAVGSLGVVLAGTGEVLTVPAGALIGGAGGAVAGGVSGLIKCSQGTGPSSGGGGTSGGSSGGNAAKAAKIARGHAFAKHAKEFGNLTQQQFESLVKQTMDTPDMTKNLLRGRVAYWSDVLKMVVIEDPASIDGGTAFRPWNGVAYLNTLK
jgi:RHS repeat-associated protein